MRSTIHTFNPAERIYNIYITPSIPDQSLNIPFKSKPDVFCTIPRSLILLSTTVIFYSNRNKSIYSDSDLMKI